MNYRLLRTGQGYSLLEALMVIAVLSILLAIAVPAADEWITSSRMTSQANDLVADLLLARSEAGARGVAVTLCPSSNGTTCIAGSNDWSSGRIVQATAFGASQVLRVGQTLTGGASLLSWDTASPPNAVSSVVFNPYGGTVPLGSGASFRLCPASDSSVTTGRLISLGSNGRPGVTRVACP